MWKAGMSARNEAQLLASTPLIRETTSSAVRDAIALDGRIVVVLDDDPTGTQTVADVPVLTAWSVPDIRWALRQGASAVYVLTNSRSLDPSDAAARTREVLDHVAEAARAERVGVVVTSRSDSTLRGHFPLETDIAAMLSRQRAAEEEVRRAVLHETAADASRQRRGGRAGRAWGRVQARRGAPANHSDGESAPMRAGRTLFPGNGGAPCGSACRCLSSRGPRLDSDGAAGGRPRGRRLRRRGAAEGLTLVPAASGVQGQVRGLPPGARRAGGPPPPPP